MRTFYKKVASHVVTMLKALQPKASKTGAAAAASALGATGRGGSGTALVKPRPATLEQRYALIDHDELADEVFLRIKQHLFTALDQSGLGTYREAGRLAPGRAYFFIQPLNEKGWLFERSGAGWIIARAQKIVSRDLFLRDGSPWDSVGLYLAHDRTAAHYPRVRSQACGGDLLSLAVYEQRLLQRLGVSAEP